MAWVPFIKAHNLLILQAPLPTDPIFGSPLRETHSLGGYRPIGIGIL